MRDIGTYSHSDVFDGFTKMVRRWERKNFGIGGILVVKRTLMFTPGFSIDNMPVWENWLDFKGGLETSCCLESFLGFYYWASMPDEYWDSFPFPERKIRNRLEPLISDGMWGELWEVLAYAQRNLKRLKPHIRAYLNNKNGSEEAKKN